LDCGGMELVPFFFRRKKQVMLDEPVEEMEIDEIEKINQKLDFFLPQ
jgi:hypothetical protein